MMYKKVAPNNGGNLFFELYFRDLIELKKHAHLAVICVQFAICVYVEIVKCAFFCYFFSKIFVLYQKNSNFVN